MVFYTEDEANRAEDHSYPHQRQASEGIPALPSDVKKKTTMLVNWGAGRESFSFPFLGVLDLKSALRPGPGNLESWPPPPAPLPAACKGPPAKCSELHSNLDQPRGPARSPRRAGRDEAQGRGRGSAGGPGAEEAAVASAAAPKDGVGGRGWACGRARTLTTPCRRRPRRCTRGWCSAAPRRTPARGPSPGPRPPPPPPCWLPGRRRRLRRAGLSSTLRGRRLAYAAPPGGIAPPLLQLPPLTRKEQGHRLGELENR